MPPQDTGLHRVSSYQHDDPTEGGDSTTTDDLRPSRHAPVGVDQIATIEPITRTSAMRRESFIVDFVHSKGPPQIVILIMLLALGFGSTIGVVPAIMSDRYARLEHGYTGNMHCGDYPLGEKPQECLDGSADAQNAVAMEQLISNSLTFFTSSLVGSLSDEYGRRPILLFGVMLSCLSPLFLLLLQLDDNMSPKWYYCAGATTGLVNWIAVALSSLSDVMPKKWRAPSFGLLIAGFSLGFAMAPVLALFMGHLGVSFFALTLVLTGFFVTLFFFPETLPPHEAARAMDLRESLVEGMSPMRKVFWNIQRPIWELSILNRNRLFRLLSMLAFFSGLVSAGDRTLLIYYIEERLGFNDRDVALMFFIMGMLGIFVQGFVLKILNEAIGERMVVTVCFCLGSLHNLLYGLASAKATIFIAVAISAFGAMAFPTISAIKSNNVEGSEQGRIQGALYSLSALASAMGPMVLRFVYHYTKDGAFLGPGSMFVVASMLYLVAVFCAYCLPDEADSRKRGSHNTDPLNSFPDDSRTTPLV